MALRLLPSSVLSESAHLLQARNKMPPKKPRFLPAGEGDSGPLTADGQGPIL